MTKRNDFQKLTKTRGMDNDKAPIVSNPFLSNRICSGQQLFSFGIQQIKISVPKAIIIHEKLFLQLLMNGSVKLYQSKVNGLNL